MSFEQHLRRMLEQTQPVDLQARAGRAHQAMMPRRLRHTGRMDGDDGPVEPPLSYQTEPPLRRSAVLIPLLPSGEDLVAILTLRPPHIRHGGQLSFPGGILHADETPREAALRETHEEIGTPPALFTVLGPLAPLHMAHTGTLVTPFVGFLRSRPAFRPQPAEVEQIVEVPLERLRDPSAVRIRRDTLRGTDYEIPFWDVHPRVPLWGATAMMLSDLLEGYRGYRERGG